MEPLFTGRIRGISIAVVLYVKCLSRTVPTWIRINAQAHKINKDGHPSKVVCYITDITGEKQLEEKLQQARDESRRNELEMQKAREADKLKSTFWPI